MFEVTFFPATFGDSIWVTYGRNDDPHHILIDGGTRGTRRYIGAKIRELPVDRRHLELVVVSHVDADHIGGVLAMLERNELDATVGDIWFNAFSHLPEPADEDESLGAEQGEALSRQILRLQMNWNVAFRGDAVVVPDEGDLPVIELPGGMRLTLLSPSVEGLAELRPEWVKEVEKAGLVPGSGELPDEEGVDDDEEVLGAEELPDLEALADTNFVGDSSEANGSSIAFLAEFEGKRVLFAADAHVPQLEDSLNRLGASERLKLDLFKISHHGSKGTVSRELLSRVQCPRFAISTNGSIYRHPDAEAVARIVAEAPGSELIFNYRNARNEIWETVGRLKGFKTRYPDDGAAGLVVTL